MNLEMILLSIVYRLANLQESFASLVVFSLLQGDVDHEHRRFQHAGILLNRMPYGLLSIFILLLQIMDSCNVVMRESPPGAHAQDALEELHFAPIVTLLCQRGSLAGLIGDDG